MATGSAVMMGGEYSSGPATGQYHVVISDAQIGTAGTGRRQFVADLVIKQDPNNAAKEGKKLTRLFQSFPEATDEIEKQKNMKGMIKRLLYDGCGIPWPEKAEPLEDARPWNGLHLWALVDKRKDKSGEERSQVVAFALKQEALPQVKAPRIVIAGARPTTKPAPVAARAHR